MKLRYALATLMVGLGTMAAAAQAQPTPRLVNAEWGYYDGHHEQREYDHGYRDGSHSGMDDARHNRAFLLYDHGSYRDHRDRDYREGFERGYRESYRDWMSRDRRNWDHDHDGYRDRY